MKRVDAKLAAVFETHLTSADDRQHSRQYFETLAQEFDAPLLNLAADLLPARMHQKFPLHLEAVAQAIPIIGIKRVQAIQARTQNQPQEEFAKAVAISALRKAGTQEQDMRLRDLLINFGMRHEEIRKTLRQD